MSKGLITYEKPRELLTDNEKAGIDGLAANGISLTVTAEDPVAAANIDLEINGEPWELKNVTNVSSSVGNQLRRVRRKWWKLNLDKPLRAVFTTEDATDTFDEIASALKERKRVDERFIVLSNENELLSL